MPHIIVEYSEHLALDIPKLLTELHTDLASRDTVDMAAIKTRAIAVKDAVIGNAEDADSFIHITLKLLPGREEPLKLEMNRGLFNIAEAHAKRPCAITVETQTLEAETYIK